MELPITKVTFNLPTVEVEALRAMAKRHSITITSAIRKAIRIEIFLDENERNGAKVLIQEPSGILSLVVRR